MFIKRQLKPERKKELGFSPPCNSKDEALQYILSALKQGDDERNSPPSPLSSPMFSGSPSYSFWFLYLLACFKDAFLKTFCFKLF